jgi:hypothetical protein
MGVRSDAASSTGSIHAKVAELRNLTNTSVIANINRSPWKAGKTVQFLYGYNSTSYTGGSVYDIVTLTGPIIILGGYLSVYSTTNYARFWVEIDGNRIPPTNIYYDNLPTAKPYLWDAASISYRNDYAYLLPEVFSNSADGSQSMARWTMRFPPLFYVDSYLKFKHDCYNTGYNRSADLKYGFYYISAA